MARKRATDNARQLLDTAAKQAAQEVRVVTAPPRGDAYTEVPIEYVVGNVRNVRADLGDLTDLAASIAADGVLQPLVVRPLAGPERDNYPSGARYVVVMGHRRLAAAAEAGQPVLPVVVRTDITKDSERQLMLIENLQRRDLSPLDEARAYADLVRDGVSQRQLAKQIGVTQPHISRRLTLLELQADLQQLIDDGQVGVDIAVSVLSSMPHAEQAAVAARIAAQPDRRWEATEIRKIADETGRAALIERVRADQRRAAAKASASIVETVEDLPEKVRADPRQHRIWERAAIAEAGRAGNLWAVVTDHRSGPEWYVGDTAGITPPPPATSLNAAPDEASVVENETTVEGTDHRPGVILPVSPPTPTSAPSPTLSGESPTPPASPDAPTATGQSTAGRTADADRDSTEESMLAAWIGGHRKIKRPELVEVAGFLLESLPQDPGDIAGRLVKSWLAPGVDGDWASWKQSLAADAKYTEDAVRAAWAYTVARDLLAGREDPDSPGGRRTAARLAATETEN